MTPLQREVAAEISAGPRGEVRGPFVALIHNPALARKAGLDTRIIDAVAHGRMPDGMPADEALVHAFCLQAHETGRVDDATFAAARERFGLDGTLELLALNGYYSMMAMVLNSACMPLPDNAAPPLNSL